MHSISIRASNGNAATWYVDRAGAGAWKSVMTKHLASKTESKFLTMSLSY